jgi:choline kinase
MPLRVCIPTAGTGSRLGDLTKHLNKSLVSISNRPILSHLIEQFSYDTEFVIALGYKGDLVRSFLELAYPDRKFFFADVPVFEGPGSGLGLSLLQCRPHLQMPFIFLSCDTLVRGNIPASTENWMGFAERDNIDAYRTASIKNGTVIELCDKKEGNALSHKPYIGLAGIADFDRFWKTLSSGQENALEEGEFFGLRSLLESGIQAHIFEWYDTGNIVELQKSRDAYKENNSANILDKPNEAIWFVNNSVIKFSNDKSFVLNRVKRSLLLGSYVPAITASTPNMYKYKKVVGHMLSETITLPLFDKFLNKCQEFWKREDLNEVQNAEFKKICLSFYKSKTFERVDLFYKISGEPDGEIAINQQTIPSLTHLLNLIDWNWLSEGLPGRFHGDLHFENVLSQTKTTDFTFLDWRQDFGGLLTYGDIYYDLAKILHGLIISHEIILRNNFSVTWGADEIRFDFYRKQILVACEKYFEKWLNENEYDVAKVKILTALIFLNIAALHHHPYNLLLFSLGKSMLFEELKGSPKYNRESVSA